MNPQDNLGVLQDYLGGLYDSAGNSIGAVAGSAADIGSGGVTFPGLPSPAYLLNIPSPTAPPSVAPLPSVPNTLTQQGYNTATGQSEQAVPITPNSGDPTPASTSSLMDDAKNVAQNLAHPLNAMTGLIFTSRFIFLVVGVILVAAGVFQFRATQTVIQTGTKAAKTGAKLAALAA
jgi:hypothetical protein